MLIAIVTLNVTYCNIMLPCITVCICHIVCDHSLYPLWPRICLYVMWLTPQFSWSVCFCVYTNVGGWHGPCPTFCCECAGLEHRLICHGGSLHCLCLHQSHKIPLFSWPYKQGASVIISVAIALHYIMAWFFVVWCNLNMMHKIPLPPFIHWPCLKLSHLRQN